MLRYAYGFVFITVFTALVTTGAAAQTEDKRGTYLGQYSSNTYAPNSTANQYGYGSQFGTNNLANPYGNYGSRFSNNSATNSYATNPPRLYDSGGNFRGNLSANPYDPNSVSNPYGRYGSRYSPDSVNNPYGLGSRYNAQSPNNPYGTGLSVYGGAQSQRPNSNGYLPFGGDD